MVNICSIITAGEDPVNAKKKRRDVLPCLKWPLTGPFFVFSVSIPLYELTFSRYSKTSRVSNRSPIGNFFK